jgi:RNA polymerase sigma-70 factor (ECF subfamily)
MCCHPALAPSAQAALSLRLVLGVETVDIARLFLVSDATMAARLTRAKRKIAASAIPFALPDASQWAERVEGIVRAVYLAFTAAYAPTRGDDLVRVEFASEAIRLAEMLDRAVPREPAVVALLALMLLQHSRRDARVADGRLVELAAQDRTAWHHDEIARGLGLLATLPPSTGHAEELRLQAQIAAKHASASVAEQTDWPAIADLYARLEQLTGSPIVRLNRAVAVAEADGPAAGLALLDGLDDRLAASHRLPAVRAELLRRCGRLDEAASSYRTAIARCGNVVEADHLERRLASLP